MSGWQNSRSTNLRHEHATRTDSSGRDVCTTCSKVIIKPITSSDDERLIDAGFQRSHIDIFLPVSAPLPEQLIFTYNDSQGEFPVAPYLITVQREHFDRGTLTEDIWERLANKV